MVFCHYISVTLSHVTLKNVLDSKRRAVLSALITLVLVELHSRVKFL